MAFHNWTILFGPPSSTQSQTAQIASKEHLSWPAAARLVRLHVSGAP